jgi:hypothetical protein
MQITVGRLAGWVQMLEQTENEMSFKENILQGSRCSQGWTLISVACKRHLKVCQRLTDRPSISGHGRTELNLLAAYLGCLYSWAHRLLQYVKSKNAELISCDSMQVAQK